jgi:primary-amine oxidase
MASLILVVIGIALGFLGGLHVHHLSGNIHPLPVVVSLTERAPLKQCPSNIPLRASPPANANPWAPLPAVDIESVQTWLFNPSQRLNLTEGRNGKDSDNIIFLIESYPPTKDDALAFLDKKSSRPLRYARVTINHGGLEVPVTRDYLVGPLPISPETTIRRLTDIYHREDIPFNARGLPDVIAFFGDLGKTLAPMSDIIEVLAFNSYTYGREINGGLKDLFNGTVKGDLIADTFTAGPSGGWGPDGSFRRYWISWKINGPGSWILPINFYTYVDSSGSDPSQWQVLKVTLNEPHLVP